MTSPGGVSKVGGRGEIRSMLDYIASLLDAFRVWYGGLSNTQAIIFLFVSLGGCFIVLSKGANLLVDGAASLASGLGVPKMIIGVTVVSLGTTLPEVSTSIMASIRGFGGVAMGNAIGSIICNAGLIFGLGCTIVRLPVERFTLNRNAWFQIGGAILLVLLYLLSPYAAVDQSGVSDGARLFPRAFGVILLAGLASYTLLSLRWAKQSVQAKAKEPNRAAVRQSEVKLGKTIVLILIGFFLIVLAARGLLTLVEQLALQLGVPRDIIAVTLLALGTSIPELATGITSLVKGHSELLVGNVIGANVLNAFWVVGASAAVRPLLIPEQFLWLHLPVMLVILGVFHLNIWTSKTYLRRWPGSLMLVIYLIYAVGSYWL